MAFYGYMSQTAKKQGVSTVYWTDKDGKEVEVISVTKSPRNTMEWSDSVSVGEVVKYSRPGMKNFFPETEVEYFDVICDLNHDTVSGKRLEAWGRLG